MKKYPRQANFVCETSAVRCALLFGDHSELAMVKRAFGTKTQYPGTAALAALYLRQYFLRSRNMTRNRKEKMSNKTS